MIRTFPDNEGRQHTLDLDLVLVDGVRCIAVRATDQNVQFELETRSVTCELVQFWREVAGPDLSPQEASLLLAECLARQVVLQRMSGALHDATCLLTRATALPAEMPTFHWLTERIDPLARRALRAYDGTPEMTGMLARILQREPATICQWARQLCLDGSSSSDQPEEAAGAPASPPHEPAEGSDEGRRQFSWTPERLRELEKALETCTASTVAERAKQVAECCGWPVEKVRSKLYERQRPRRADQPNPREGEAGSSEMPMAISSLSPVILKTGNLLWTIMCGEKRTSWALDYGYGSFPLQVGQHCLYGESVYEIERVSTSMLHVALLEVQQDTSLDVQCPAAVASA